MSSALPASNPYLRFVWVPNPGRKTERWLVLSDRSGALLGSIQWFGRWRQYAFRPEDETLFNPDCLDAIATNVRHLTTTHRRAVTTKEEK